MSGEQVRRKVKVEGSYLNFSAAHFITYRGKCEHLHGHNYSVLVEIEGELGEDQLVFDFTILKRRTKEICQQLDHRFLLPLSNSHLKINESATSWEIFFGERHYLFPREDVVVLHIANTTAELLAEYICDEIRKTLRNYPQSHLFSITVGVGEAPMQMAYYSTSL
jgi:6-pyruvoyl tetrahydropterin synthase/QueD family protein